MDETKMIHAIEEYLFDLGEPEPGWPTKEFERVAYSRWAADEILRFVLSHLDWTPMKSVEVFKCQVGKYAQVKTNHEDADYIFEIAYHVASDISDILYAMNY